METVRELRAKELEIAVSKAEERRLRESQERKSKARGNINHLHMMMRRLRTGSKHAAARFIQRWVRERLQKIRELEIIRWLPADIDIETADASIVWKILQPVDLNCKKRNKLLKLQPRLIAVTLLQRFIRKYLKVTKLQRFVKRCVKL